MKKTKNREKAQQENKSAKFRFSVVAPAVEALVIVFFAVILTMVTIGQTFAKFVSKISSGSAMQTASFVVDGFTSASLSEDVIIAPGQTKNISASFNYFSQVDTEFLNAGTSKIEFTGAWADFSSLVNEYYDYCDNLGLTPNAPSSLEECFALTFNGEDNLVAAIVKALVAKGEETAEVGDLVALGSHYTAVSAMSSSASSMLRVQIPISITWIDDGNDSWDTFLGEKVAESVAATEIRVKFNFTAQQVVGDLTEPPVLAVVNGVEYYSYVVGQTVGDLLDNSLLGVTRAGFGGWYTDPACTNLAAESTVITVGMSLYASSN